jgi:hypothetical protein
MSNIRLRTTFETEQQLLDIQNNLHFSSKAAVMRLAIGIVLQEQSYKNEIIEIKRILLNNDNYQGDYNRYTIFPQDELLYKILIEEYLEVVLDDNDFFPGTVNAFLIKGCSILYKNLKMYAKDRVIEKILTEGID